MKIIMRVFLVFIPVLLSSQSTYQIAILKYNGGGDWYSNPTSLPNLIEFCNTNISTNIKKNVATVEVGSADIFNFPFIYMTGHGNVVFSDQESKNLKNYLLSGGFLHIDDNYGMDQYIRIELQKVFPEKKLIELPSSHKIFHQTYNFDSGLPKIHEHDQKNPKAYGIFIENRLVLLYTYESDLGDGWEDAQIHNNSQSTRTSALMMGANIIEFVFTQ